MSDLQKHTLFLFAGDWQRLSELYPDVSTSLILRKIIRAHIAQIEKSSKVEAPKPEITI